MKRLHPVSIFENISRYFWLLLLPLLRGLFSYRGGFLGWLGGVWLDLLVLAVIFAFAFFRWLLSGYRLGEDGVTVKKGLFLRRELVIPYREFASVTAEEPFYYRPLRAVRLYADSEVGNLRRHDLVLTLSSSAAKELLGRSLGRFDAFPKENTFRSGNLYIVFLALISSRSLTGVLLFAAFLMQAGRILGQELASFFFQSLTDLAERLAFGVPTAAVVLALIVFCGWSVSFFVHLSRNVRFSVSREENRLLIRSGLLSHHTHILNVEKVVFVEMRQSILTKIAGIASLFLSCAGYGKMKYELEVLFPAAGKKRIRALLENTVPEWCFCERTVFPKGSAVFGLVSVPLLLFGVIFAASLFSGVLFPAFAGTIRLFGSLVMLPLLWWLLARIFGFYHVGISEKEGYYTLRCMQRFGFRTLAVHREKVVRITVRRSVWQRLSGNCTVEFRLRSEGTRKAVIPAVKYSEARALLENTGFDSLTWEERYDQ